MDASVRGKCTAVEQRYWDWEAEKYAQTFMASIRFKKKKLIDVVWFMILTTTKFKQMEFTIIMIMLIKVYTYTGS